MGKAQKKHGKGRLDHYYRLAKEKGYRARSSFKIIQINQKFGHFLEKSKVVIDLCAAPGSWCQVASQLCPINSLIIGVDLAPIKPLPNVIAFQSDITTEHCRSTLRGHMKTWKADCVMHDGAPNVGMAWTQDAFTQSELVLQSLKLAVEFLVQGGVFVTKVFRSKDYNKLMYVFGQFFEKVEATKPPASRNVSAEIFVVCRGFKAPRKIDPRLLDTKTVFEEIVEAPQNMQAKVFNPEKKTRKRDGYEDGDYLLFHTMDVMDFIKHDDPIQCLGSMSQLTVDEGDSQIKDLLSKSPISTDLKLAFKDLKVLGKKDFRVILKWRKAARDTLGLDKKEKDELEGVQVEPLTEEEQISKEMEDLTAKKLSKDKRDRRKRNEQRQKEQFRIQMNMTSAMDIGVEAGSQSESLFNLKQASRKALPENAHDTDEGEDGEENHEDEEMYSDEDLDALDEQMDHMYDKYRERQAERHRDYEAKRAREKEDDSWYGFDENKGQDGNESDSSEYYDAQEGLEVEDRSGAVSSSASMFFQNSIFDDIDMGDEPKPKVLALPDVDSDEDSDVEEEIRGHSVPLEDSATKSDDDIEIVTRDDDDDDETWSGDENDERAKEPIVDIVTAEAMTMAHELALGKRTKQELIDQSYGRMSFRDTDGLPQWFLDDEQRHLNFSKPITKEAAEAIKAKLRAMNARPTKKVAEAVARKKYKAMKKLETIRKKSGLLMEDENKSERDKAEEISQLMKKMGKKQTKRPKVTVIAARGSNRGLQGRPKGVKGKYKMVDGTMKKEQRALNRIKKSKGK